MKYEIHITTETIEVPDFCDRLNHIGIKPAVLLLNTGEFHQMTSYIAEAQLETLRVIDLLQAVGLKPIRVKIERPPSGETSLYYEAHYDGMIPGLPCAVNIVKKEPIISATYREYNMRLDIFRKLAYNLAQEYNLPKPYIEECVFDNNIELDDNWMRN